MRIYEQDTTSGMINFVLTVIVQMLAAVIVVL